MLPRDVPDGPWQESAVDYLTHQGKKYLIICNVLSKYPFLHKVTTMSAQSLCASLLELISQYGLLSLLSTDNGLPFVSEDLTQFPLHHHIEHSTSSPHFPKSNGFIECHVSTIKTVLNTTLMAKKPLDDVLLDLRLTLNGSNMPLPCEILHNRTFQCPSRPSQPVNMERVQDYLLSCKQAQCTHFNKAHGVCALPELIQGQEVLFRSPVDGEYIPGTIIHKAIMPHSYLIEAHGKWY